jgi:hypothetical protein
VEERLLHQVEEERLLHQVEKERLLHQVEEERLLHQVEEERLLHQVEEEGLPGDLRHHLSGLPAVEGVERKAAGRVGWPGRSNCDHLWKYQWGPFHHPCHPLRGLHRHQLVVCHNPVGYQHLAVVQVVGHMRGAARY